MCERGSEGMRLLCPRRHLETASKWRDQVGMKLGAYVTAAAAAAAVVVVAVPVVVVVNAGSTVVAVGEMA